MGICVTISAELGFQDYTSAPIDFRGIPSKNMYIQEYGIDSESGQQVISAKTH